MRGALAMAAITTLVAGGGLAAGLHRQTLGPPRPGTITAADLSEKVASAYQCKPFLHMVARQNILLTGEVFDIETWMGPDRLRTDVRKGPGGGEPFWSFTLGHGRMSESAPNLVLATGIALPNAVVTYDAEGTAMPQAALVPADEACKVGAFTLSWTSTQELCEHWIGVQFIKESTIEPGDANGRSCWVARHKLETTDDEGHHERDVALYVDVETYDLVRQDATHTTDGKVVRHRILDYLKTEHRSDDKGWTWSLPAPAAMKEAEAPRH